MQERILVAVVELLRGGKSENGLRLGIKLYVVSPYHCRHA